jgi:hypothetical protein
MSLMDNMTGNTEVIESTPIMMNAMKMVERRLAICASLKTSLRRMGIKILESRRAVTKRWLDHHEKL